MTDKLADIIRKNRKMSGLTQIELAKLADVGKGTIYDLEHGKHSIQFDNIEKVCKVLNIKINFIEPSR